MTSRVKYWKEISSYKPRSANIKKLHPLKRAPALKKNYLQEHSDAQSQSLLESINSKYYYYTRTKGLFRICYPKERPPTVKTYLSPVETHCSNVNYYLPDENNDTRDFTDDAWTRLRE
ncbi:unnamed protein product [Phaedon cochleariae]|uniref:Uncharacterized protein n=1 Tax=Phaedon cochleariae TaxID=80249 RepID=A0A9N9WZQ6_PHACE|nr:unnamed protein product [Phaedon cochleariae]